MQNLIISNNISKKKIITNKFFTIPVYKDFFSFANEKYNVTFLKEICKKYKLKVSGNKSELKDRIYKYLHNSYHATKIQKMFKGYLIRSYLKLLGPALYNRNCTNEKDFYTLERIKDIDTFNFFSYVSNNNIWGFNIISIYNLFLKSNINNDNNNNSKVLNPWTREPIDFLLFRDIKKIIRLSKIINKPINLIIEKENNVSIKKNVELKCLELFQIIDRLGNYTDVNWFLSLNKYSIIKFIKELYDIWAYRAQLEYSVKKNICHPTANPFRNINLNNLNYLNSCSLISLQKTTLFIIEQFITKGISTEFCNLGASYVLCGLTLVNSNAADALPWLYESVVF